MTRSAIERSKRREARRERRDLARLSKWLRVAQYVEREGAFSERLQRLDAVESVGAIESAVRMLSLPVALDADDRADVFEQAGYAVRFLRDVLSDGDDLLAARAIDLSWCDAEVDADEFSFGQRRTQAAALHDRACTIVSTSSLVIAADGGASWVWSNDRVATTYCRVRELRGVPVYDPRREVQVSRRLRTPPVRFDPPLEGGSNGE